MTMRARQIHARVLSVFAIAGAFAVFAFVLPNSAQAVEADGAPNQLVAARLGATTAGDDNAAVAMFRLYNPNSGEHFYTSSVEERDWLADVGWNDEGAGWMAPSQSNTPVYRLYSGTDHHYTTEASERDMLVQAGWSYEGIGWYSDDDESVALLRQFNPNVIPLMWRNNSGSHNFTTSSEENDMLVKAGWQAEGIGWYGTNRPLYVGSYGVVEDDPDIWIETSPYYEVHVSSQVGDEIAMDIVSSGRNGTPLCYANCSATVVDGVAEFDYEDNFGNSGKGAIAFSDGQADVAITQTNTSDSSGTIARTQQLPLTSRSVILAKAKRTPDQLRARMDITEDYRASFDHGYKGGAFQRYIVLHDTEGDGPASGVVDWWDSNGRCIAAHFVVNKDGSIVQCVPLDRIAHHAGYGNTGHNGKFEVEDSRDDKRGTASTISDVADYGMNSWSIGIEMVHAEGSTYYPEAQLVAVDRLVAYINAYYGYPSAIIAHNDWRLGNSDTSPAFAGYLANYKDHGTHY